jgi:hypothetical protein
VDEDAASAAAVEGHEGDRGACQGVQIIDLDEGRRWDGTAHDHSVQAISQGPSNVWTGDERGVIRMRKIADLPLPPPELAPVEEVRLGARVVAIHALNDDAILAATTAGLVRLDLHQAD